MPLPVAGQMPASRTHAARRWTFIATADARPGCGVLTIVQGKTEVDSYAVEVEGGKVLFCKLADGDIYGVDLHAGRPVRCNCKGYSFKRTCKHVDAAREMLADEVLAVR